MFDLLLNSKPVLVGLHLGFAILGIDFMLWHLGELVAKSKAYGRMKFVAWGSLASFILSWLIGGYYYVKFYGPLVKPEIKASSVPWVHDIVMEAKEHIFLFLIPLAATIVVFTMFKHEELEKLGLGKTSQMLVAMTAVIALGLGLMGFMISATARWGA